MRLHRFYLQNENFETLKAGDSFTCTNPEIVRQLGLVLRAQVGDSIRFFNNSGEWEFGIESVSKKEVFCNTKSKISPIMQKNKVFLLQSLIKKDKFEWVAQKCTELGVTDIIPIISERSEKKGLDKKRLQKIIIEATEQSGWGMVPTLHEITLLENALQKLENDDVTIHTLDMDGKLYKKGPDGPVAICIGPEGGWGERDKEILKKHSVESVSLGESILRAETAAIVGVYSVLKHN